MYYNFFLYLLYNTILEDIVIVLIYYNIILSFNIKVKKGGLTLIKVKFFY